MKVYQLIEYLKTLEQYYDVLVGDSEYPNDDISEDKFHINADAQEYVIY